MFNIAARELKDTTVLHLVDPATGNYMYADEAETKPLTITVYGRASKPYKNWMASAMRKNETAARAKKTKTLDEQLADNAEFLASLSIKAENFDLNGVALDNKAAFIELYSNPSLAWINEQITEVLGDNSAFLE